MTISTELRKSGPFTGNGVTTAFPFSFKVFAASDVAVTRADTLGAETALVLNSDFTVTLNPDQDAAPGGTVTLAAPLATGTRLAVTSVVPNLQPTDITNNGGFYPRVIEDALDRHVAQIQQIDEKVARALKVAITSPLGDQALPAPVAGMLIGWNESNDGLKNYAPIGGTLLGQQLAAADGSSLVGFQQAGTGAVVRTAQDKMREWVSVKDFGAVGDGVADDTAAIHAAIVSWCPISFGGVGDVYRITSGILVTLPAAVNWRSAGAAIVLDSAAHQKAVLGLTVTGKSHRIEGKLTIDVAQNANIGLLVEIVTAAGTYPAGYGDVFADGLTVLNPYRKDSTFAESAEGILVRGPFASVVLENPTVRNSVLATGAGIFGSYGAFGISVLQGLPSSIGQPQSIAVQNCVIEGVYCEDPAYEVDQDGLRVVVSNGPSAPAEPSLEVRGGVIRDCHGRGIKSQCANTLVDGVRFTRRTSGFARGYGNHEIDFQEGGGRATNIQCAYIGHVPDTVVQFSSTRETGKVNVPFGSISGLEIIVGAGLTLPSVFENRVWNDGTSQIIRAQNIEVRGVGALTNFCAFNGYNSGIGFHLLLSDNLAAPTDAWVVCGSGPATGTIKAARQVHTGSSPATFRRTASTAWRPQVSTRDCIGFTAAVVGSNGLTTHGTLERIGSLTGDSVDSGGIVKVFSFTLAENETFTFPVFGGNSNQGILLIAGLGQESSGVFSRDASGVKVLSAGSNFAVGTTSEPTGAVYRLWYDTGAEAHVLKNTLASSRLFTCLCIG